MLTSVCILLCCLTAVNLACPNFREVWKESKIDTCLPTHSSMLMETTVSPECCHTIEKWACQPPPGRYESISPMHVTWEKQIEIYHENFPEFSKQLFGRRSAICYASNFALRQKRLESRARMSQTYCCIATVDFLDVSTT